MPPETKDDSRSTTLTETAKVRIDPRGRLYVKHEDLWNSRIFREQLKQMAELEPKGTSQITKNASDRR